MSGSWNGLYAPGRRRRSGITEQSRTQGYALIRYMLIRYALIRYVIIRHVIIRVALIIIIQ